MLHVCIKKSGHAAGSEFTCFVKSVCFGHEEGLIQSTFLLLYIFSFVPYRIQHIFYLVKTLNLH